MTATKPGGPSGRYDRIFNSVFQPSFDPSLTKGFNDPSTIAWNRVTPRLRPSRTAEIITRASDPSEIDGDAFRCLLSNDETRRRLVRNSIFETKRPAVNCSKVDWLSNEAQEHQDSFVVSRLQGLWSSVSSGHIVKLYLSGTDLA